MEWRGLGGRLQRSLVTATSFMDYGSLVVINGITADHGAFVSLLGEEWAFLSTFFAIRHKEQLNVAAEMETLSWIGQKFLPSCYFCRLTPVAYTASLALDCGFFAMGLHHSVIIFIFIFSIGLKTLQILGLDSYKKGGVRQERMECVESATLQFSGRAFFFNISRFMGLVIGLRLTAGSCGA